MEQIVIDPEFASLFLPLPEDRRAVLEADIVARGCRVPLDVWGSILIDGHNRYEICIKHGIAFETKQIDFDDRLSAEIWILENQIARRNLNDLEKISTGLKLELKQAEKAKQRQQLSKGRGQKGPEILPDLKGDTRDIVAKMLGMSGRTYEKGKKVVELGVPELSEALANCRVSISAAAEIASLPRPVQVELCKQEDISLSRAARDIHAEKFRQRKLERLEVIKSMPWPDNKYRVIYADPPWSYDNSGLDASAAKQYETMSTDDICAMPVADMATKDAVLFMWGTSPLLPDALRVIESWGFEYKTSIIWDKDRPNYGNYVSVQHEFLFIATRGACTPDIELRPSSVMRIERTGRHSEKPAEFRDLINTLYPHGPRIEMFARTAAEGWERWGNEAA